MLGLRPNLEHQAGALENLQVLGDRLNAHIERDGKLVQRGLPVLKRSRIARRVGSASAAKTTLSSSVAVDIKRLLCQVTA
jgi:hypothetical protein